jgi:DNA ligase-1
MTFRPLLAAKAEISSIDFTEGVLISRKLDGIRVLGMSGKAMTRSMKELPNRYIQSVFASGVYDGLDGEIIVGPPNATDVFRVTNSAVMSRDGEPDFTYHVFDRWDMPQHGFQDRYNGLHELNLNRVRVVPHITVHDLTGLDEMEAQWLAEGYEGVMGRSLTGGYKQGRSTMNEGILWKLKRFADHEYEVIGFEELMHNDNEATINELGHTQRSSHMENKRGGGVLGALVLRHPEAGVFRCGTGFTAADRAEIWANRNSYLGRMAKIKHFEIGVKDLPRFPVWLGFRAEEDM